MHHDLHHARRAPRPRGRRLLATAIAGLTAIAVAPVIAPQASAATTTVSCTGTADIARVQAAVNAASDGDTILVRGTCDFRNASPHGGSTTSITDAAVLVRPGTPVQDLTIMAADGPQSATFLGGGDETAFAVAPDNDGLTIKGLVFRNFGRAITVLGADDVTIGFDDDDTPDPEANHIFGGLTQDSAILGVGTSEAMTISYGGGAQAGIATVVPGDLRNFRVSGNYVQYAPPGPGSPFGAADVVAIDVRQKGTAIVDDVTINENAVGMFTSDFASFSQNSIRVHGETPIPGSTPPVLADYRITDVTIADNNLGRLEEIDPELLPDEVNPGDAHAGGRVGVVLFRVGNFDVHGNSLRSRISVTGESGQPGGGILAADSSFGSISQNKVITLSDPGSQESRDAGGIGLIDGLAAMFGGAPGDQGTYDIAVGANTIGKLVHVRRGVVLAGARKATIHENEIRSTGAGVSFGANVQGPSGAAATTVTETVACRNVFNGNTDGADGTVFADDPNANGNSFPRGSLTTSSDNGECEPTLTVVPGPPQAVHTGDSLFAHGRAWADRDVEVKVTDDTGAFVTKTVTADGLGGYSAIFQSSELTSLVDGLLVVVATAKDSRGFELSSDPVSSILDLNSGGPSAGDAIIDDGGDGYTSVVEALAGTYVYWLAPSGAVVEATIWFSDGNGVIPNAPECGPVSDLDPTGAAILPVNCAMAMPQGTYRFNVQWRAADNTMSPVVTDTSILDTQTTVPTIATPTQGSTSSVSNIVVSGTAEPHSTVIVQRDTRAALGNAVADNAGNWSTTISFADGTHRISAFSFDVAGNRSAASALRTFHVNTAALDTTPPAPPVIASPVDGGLYRSAVPFSGTAEAGARVDLRIGTSVFGSLFAGASGGWGEIQFMPTGTHTITAVAVDRAGNVSAPSAPVTFTVDADVPEIEITTKEDSVRILTDVVIDGRVRDNDSAVKVVVEYYDIQQNLVYVGDEADCLSPGCPTPAGTWVDWQHNGNEPSVGAPREFFPPGIYYARAVAVDRAGNTAEDVVRFVVVQA